MRKEKNKDSLEVELRAAEVQSVPAYNNYLAGMTNLTIETNSEFRVNNYTIGSQKKPSIATFNTGSAFNNDQGYVIAWESYRQDSDREGIYAQLYIQGKKYGNEFRVNNITKGAQINPKVTGLSNGFVIGFEDSNSIVQGKLKVGSSLYLQRFDGDGSKIGNNIRVGNNLIVPTSDMDKFYYENRHLDISSKKNISNNFWITWESSQMTRIKKYFNTNNNGCNRQEYSYVKKYIIYAQKFNSDIVNITSPIIVNNNLESLHGAPHVEMFEDERAIIVWHSNNSTQNSFDIYAQTLSTNGLRLGSSRKINIHTISDQKEAVVAVLQDQSLIIAWESHNQDGQYSGLFARRFSTNTTGLYPISEEFQVNAYKYDDQKNAAISSLNNGGFVIAWDSRGQEESVEGVFAQKFLANTTRYGREIQVNINSRDAQKNPAVVPVYGSTEDEFTVVWDSMNQDGSAEGIYTRHVAPINLTLRSRYIPVDQVSQYLDGYINKNITALKLAIQNATATPPTQQDLEAQRQAIPPGDHILRDYAFFSNGNFVFFFANLNQFNPHIEMQARVFDKNSNQIGNNITIARFNKVNNARIITLDDQSLVMIYSVIDPSKENYHILMQRMHPSDQVVEDVFDLYPSYRGVFNVNRFINSTSLILSYLSQEHNLVMQKFTLQNNKLNQDYTVTKYLPDTEPTFIINAKSNDGSFVLVWSYLDYNGIFAQRYNVTGGYLGIQTHIDVTPKQIKIDMAKTGEYVIGWESHDNYTTPTAYIQSFSNISQDLSNITGVSNTTEEVLRRVNMLNSTAMMASLMTNTTFITRIYSLNGTLLEYTEQLYDTMNEVESRGRRAAVQWGWYDAAWLAFDIASIALVFVPVAGEISLAYRAYRLGRLALYADRTIEVGRAFFKMKYINILFTSTKYAGASLNAIRASSDLANFYNIHSINRDPIERGCKPLYQDNHYICDATNEELEELKLILGKLDNQLAQPIVVTQAIACKSYLSQDYSVFNKIPRFIKSIQIKFSQTNYYYIEKTTQSSFSICKVDSCQIYLCSDYLLTSTFSSFNGYNYWNLMLSKYEIVSNFFLTEKKFFNTYSSMSNFQCHTEAKSSKKTFEPACFSKFLAASYPIVSNIKPSNNKLIQKFYGLVDEEINRVSSLINDLNIHLNKVKNFNTIKTESFESFKKYVCYGSENKNIGMININKMIDYLESGRLNIGFTPICFDSSAASAFKDDNTISICNRLLDMNNFPAVYQSSYSNNEVYPTVFSGLGHELTHLAIGTVDYSQYKVNYCVIEAARCGESRNEAICWQIFISDSYIDYN